MKAEYRYVDDRREKEGDEAREGYFFRFNFTSDDHEEITEMVRWLSRHLNYPQNIRVVRGSSSYQGTTEYNARVVIKDIDDATLVRLHLGMDCFSTSQDK